MFGLVYDFCIIKILPLIILKGLYNPSTVSVIWFPSPYNRFYMRWEGMERVSLASNWADWPSGCAS